MVRSVPPTIQGPFSTTYEIGFRDRRAVSSWTHAFRSPQEEYGANGGESTGIRPIAVESYADGF